MQHPWGLAAAVFIQPCLTRGQHDTDIFWVAGDVVPDGRVHPSRPAVLRERGHIQLDGVQGACRLCGVQAFDPTMRSDPCSRRVGTGLIGSRLLPKTLNIDVQWGAESLCSVKKSCSRLLVYVCYSILGIDHRDCCRSTIRTRMRSRTGRTRGATTRPARQSTLSARRPPRLGSRLRWKRMRPRWAVQQPLQTQR